ncbi:DUF2790 domain-containing protein [Pseudomonas entomophila]|uniref:DUF2790 domain-containing protein n=1 Tax=Pseudomonas entomophila TaxID=312306 RepID=UPI0023D8797C|nr:DUF2790 domain-containing protein [Pseudomonas entomophila]MDF0733166.1 DUF2790 domain-containing protein [Pseudomonas entomophila]
MKPLLILALVGMSSFALAHEANATSTEPVVQYEYGMHLDIKRVINLSGIPETCQVEPATMTYEDHQGQVHTIRYRVMGEGCNQG